MTDSKTRRIVFATNNANKLREIREILGDSLQVASLRDIGCFEDIPETADTIAENARMKARYVAERYGVDCFADDTGLEVEALGGAPGVRSARYATDGHDSEANMALLLRNLEGVENRRARFVTVISLIVDGKEYVMEGVCPGHIATVRAGSDGFGYDPVFVPDGSSLTFAEMTHDEKNALSHRGKATRLLIEKLKNL